MRVLRELAEQPQAELVRDALRDAQIESQISETQDGIHVVWVVDETELDRARELAERWLSDAGNAELIEAARRGRLLKDHSDRIEQRKQRQIESMREQLASATKPRPTPLTWGIIAMCIAIFGLSQGENLESVLRALAIVDPRLPPPPQIVSLFGQSYLISGLPWSEPWRFLTPVLVHNDLMHLGFNMLMLLQLGRVLEMRHGTRTLFALTIVSGVISNIAQYEITANPLFAGFSGVVYALLGALWVRGRIDPRAGYKLSQGAVSFMLIWLVFGFLIRSPTFRLANYCHLFGLLVGMAWGFVGAKLAARPRSS